MIKTLRTGMDAQIYARKSKAGDVKGSLHNVSMWAVETV